MNGDAEKRRAIAAHSAQARQFADAYEHQADRYQSCFSYSRHRLAAVLKDYLPEEGEGVQVLDVGCGTGHHIKELRLRGFEVAGVDGSNEMLQFARANNPGADIRSGDVEDLPFPTATFDIVLCIEVFRYLRDPEPCIAELARVLRPGGLCLATATPLLNANGYWLVNRMAALVPIGNLVRLQQFFVTSSSIVARFRRQGFRDVDLRGVYGGPINWVERLTPRILAPVLQKWERVDSTLSNLPMFRELANMFLIAAVRS